MEIANRIAPEHLVDREALVKPITAGAVFIGPTRRRPS
jgi:histidinol dehydrogenase